MKKKGFMAGALALALLAGCSGTAAPDDIAYQASDIRRDAELVTVDGQPIRAENYLFWLANSIESAKQYGELADDAAWEEALDDGMTLSEALKADALETAKLYRVVETKAGEYGVTITTEQEQEIEEQMAQAIESMGGEESFQAKLDALCISREGFAAMNRIYYLNQGLKEKLEESGEIAVTGADKEKAAQELLDEGGIYAAKHILLSTRRTNADGTYEEFTEEERAAVEERAKAMRQQLRDAGDSEALFDELMNEFSEDSRDENGELYYPDGYGLIYSGQMVPEFEAGAVALAEGQISEPIASSYGYHLILRIPVDQDQLGQLVEYSCTTERKLQELTEQWMDQAQVVTTTAYDELDPKEFYDRLTAINEARAAARETPAAQESGGVGETPVESAAPSEDPAPAESPAE